MRRAEDRWKPLRRFAPTLIEASERSLLTCLDEPTGI